MGSSDDNGNGNGKGKEKEKEKDISVYDFEFDDADSSETSCKNFPNQRPILNRDFFRKMFQKKNDSGENPVDDKDGHRQVSDDDQSSSDESDISPQSTENCIDDVSNEDQDDEYDDATLDHSMEHCAEYTTDDEETSDSRNSPSDTMYDALEEEEGGYQECSDSDASKGSDPSEDSEEYEDSDWSVEEVIICPEFGYHGNVLLLMPELVFSTESIKLSAKKQNSTSEKTHDINWSISDIEDIKYCLLSHVGTAVLMFSLKDHCADKMTQYFDENVELQISFMLGAGQLLQLLRQILSLNNAYRDIIKLINVGSEPGDCDISEILTSTSPERRQNDSISVGRFEETLHDFVFPVRDPDAVTISGRDVMLLQLETFINDTLIDFYIKYLQTTIPFSMRGQYHFFNSFFFRKLADMDKAPDTTMISRNAFLRVKKWTRKVDIFSKKYIFIPVNYGYHWSLIVICNPGVVCLEGDSKAVSPCILHMDSLVGTHGKLSTVIQSYLLQEWRERTSANDEQTESISGKFFSIPFISCEVPQQENGCDCGLFLLHYVERFLREVPPNFDASQLELCSRFLTRTWFIPAEASSIKRCLIRELIYKLYNEQIATENLQNSCQDYFPSGGKQYDREACNNLDTSGNCDVMANDRMSQPPLMHMVEQMKVEASSGHFSMVFPGDAKQQVHTVYDQSGTPAKFQNSEYEQPKSDHLLTVEHDQFSKEWNSKDNFDGNTFGELCLSGMDEVMGDDGVDCLEAVQPLLYANLTSAIADKESLGNTRSGSFENYTDADGSGSIDLKLLSEVSQRKEDGHFEESPYKKIKLFHNNLKPDEVSISKNGKNSNIWKSKLPDENIFEIKEMPQEHTASLTPASEDIVLGILPEGVLKKKTPRVTNHDQVENLIDESPADIVSLHHGKSNCQLLDQSDSIPISDCKQNSAQDKNTLDQSDSIPISDCKQNSAQDKNTLGDDIVPVSMSESPSVGVKDEANATRFMASNGHGNFLESLSIDQDVTSKNERGETEASVMEESLDFPSVSSNEVVKEETKQIPECLSSPKIIPKQEMVPKTPKSRRTPKILVNDLSTERRMTRSVARNNSSAMLTRESRKKSLHPYIK